MSASFIPGSLLQKPALDLTRPEHREALKWAAETKAQAPSVVGYWSVGDDLAGGLRQEAIRALSSPSQSAALVRALLEGCGVPTKDLSPLGRTAVVSWHEATNIAQTNACITFQGDVRRGEPGYLVWSMQDIPALILALLDATDRDGALAALRNASR